MKKLFTILTIFALLCVAGCDELGFGNVGPNGKPDTEDQKPESTEPHKIYYTSVDGCVVTPNAIDVFGANIVSNTYENGVGVITFDGAVTSIAGWAFEGCSSLASITIPEGVTSIGNGAFSYCTRLASITIPEGVTSIEYSAFRGCLSLASITIPESVVWIGSQAFYNCSNLAEVYCKPTTPPTVDLGGDNHWDAFDFNALGRKIYVPTESVEVYKAADGWSEIANAIVGYNFE